jgi:hypothetical protein
MRRYTYSNNSSIGGRALIPKCVHGNYNGKKEGEPSDYCTGCKSPETVENREEILRLELVWNKKLEENSSQ